MTYRTMSPSGIMFSCGVSCGVCLVVFLRWLFVAESDLPPWSDNKDVIVRALTDNLESSDDEVRLYAVWRLGEMRGHAQSALSALENMNLGTNEGLGKERAKAIYKIQDGR